MANMTGFDEHLAMRSSGHDRIPITGVSATTDIGRMIETLAKIGLVEDRYIAPCRQLAASGKDISEYVSVSVVDLDRALRNFETGGPENRMAFKASLHRAGLLKVPK
jgi:hypothetical protein